MTGIDRTAPGAAHGPAEPKMRVLVLNSTFGLGGAERVTYDLVTRLDAAECQALLGTFYEPGTMGETFVRAGYRLYPHLMRSKYDAWGLRRLETIVKRHRVDLLYVLAQPVTLFWTVLFSRLYRVPIVALVSNTIVLREKAKFQSYRWLMPQAARIVAVANGQKDHLVREIGIRPDIVSVVHNGIDSQRFEQSADRAEIRTRAGLRADARVVGLVARLVPLKAVDVLLRAAKSITDRRPDVQFAIVGAGPEMKSLRALSRALGLEQSVRFTGFVEEPASILGGFDIGVLCSRTEALPMSVLEYMAAGLPCVVTDVGSTRELVIDGETGFVIHPDDPGALASRITQLLDDPALARRMGDSGRQRVKQRFTLNRMARDTTDIFHEVLGHY